MNEHICNKEKEITEMHTMITRIDSAIRGNGKPGILTGMAVMKNTICGIIALNVIIVSCIVGLWFGK